MKTTSQTRKTAGFTLVELLVVIMIVVSLAGIGAYAMRGAFGKADRMKALRACTDLVSAIENFKIDHNGLYPIDAYPEGDRDMVLKSDEYNNMMKILTNRETGNTSNKINQAGKPYFAAEEHDAPIGLYVKGNDIGLYDPWKSPYIVVLDTNYDHKVTDPTDPGKKTIHKEVIVISPGPDMKYGNIDDNADNVYSFKSGS